MRPFISSRTSSSSTASRGPIGRIVLAIALVLSLLAALTGPSAASGRDEGSTIRGGGQTPVVGGIQPVRGGGPPPLRSDVEAIELELVQGVQTPPDVGPPVVIPVNEPPPDPTGQLAGNQYGCSATCITEALLHKSPFTPTIELEMTTNVLTTKYVWVLPPGPFLVNGLPAHIGMPPAGVSGSGYTWNTDLLGLSYDSVYRIVIDAVDLQGNHEIATTLVTTTEGPPDQLVGNGSGCYYDCIESGTVSLGDSFDVATIELVADTDVTFQVAVSTSPPFEINGNPWVTNEVNLNVTNQTATSLTGQLTGLAGDTTYHVVAEATDGDGYAHYAVGSFTTDPEPVVAPEPQPVTVTFEKIKVLSNGDTLGFGEIRFKMGIGPDGSVAYWQTAEHKLGDGDTWTTEYGTTLLVEEGEVLPDLIVNAIERDVQFPSAINSCGTGQTLYEDPIAPGCADGSLSISAGVLGGVTVDWIETLSTCEPFSLPAYKDDLHCVNILSHGSPGNDFVTFEALVSFELG
ncbi:MAG: hypothetical protein AAGA93_05920 [Actinomycetota bacterium]